MPDAHHDDIAKLESLYEEHPEGRVFTHLAEAYRKGGELERARQVLSEGIERHPDYSSAHVVLGRVLMDQDRTAEAEEAFQRVLDLDPHNLIAIRSLGDLARARGDDDRALEFYHRLLDQEPGEEEVREIVDEMTTGLAVGDLAGETDVPDRAWTGEATVTLPEEEEEPAFTLGAAGDEDDRSPDRLEEEPDFTLNAADDEGRREPELRPEEDFGDVEVRTETIAQVYARQGLYDRAAEVYRELVRARPDDEGLRERLSEMEQLAEARTAGADEVEAVSDLEVEESGRLPGLEPDRADEEAPDEEAPDEESPDEPEPAAFGLEGLQTTEVDTSEAEATSLPDLEMEESDPDTGLRADAAPDTASPEADLSDELEVTDVPEPPEETPWDGGLGVEAAEADRLEEEHFEEEGVEEERADAPELEGAESIWTGAEWRDEAEPETTPHAWTDPEDEEDASPPIREYLGGLLSWPGSGVATEAVESERPADAVESKGAEDADESEGPTAVESEGPMESPESEGPMEPLDSRGSAGAASGGPPGQESPEDDDDLDMFRSWLESLKQ